MPPVCCYVPYTTLVTRGGVYPAVRDGMPAVTKVASSIWATDVPGWITAIATAGLLIGAIITAIYAILAYRKQTEELREQRKLNALQADDLKASLLERERELRVAEREQANAIEFAWWPSSHVLIVGSAGGNANVANAAVLAVRNSSRRRIINVTCRAAAPGRPGLTLPPEKTGQLTETGSPAQRAILNMAADGSTVQLIRSGSWYGFLLKFDLQNEPRTRLAVHFTDDAGLHWEIDQDLHLKQFESRPW